MQHYVLGFVFDERQKQVALIKKTKPAWQAGKWNGIGGKIEDGEVSVEAMKREFMEETGVVIDQWRRFTRIVGSGYQVDCYRAFTNQVFNVGTTTDEEVAVFFVEEVIMRADLGQLDNVRWLVTMALSEPQFYVLSVTN